MQTREFTRDFLLSVLDGSAEDVSVMRNDILRLRDGVGSYELVFRYEENLYQCLYKSPDPWAGEDVVECPVVQPEQYIAVRYVSIDDEARTV